jgi:hypothetical protein
MPGHLHGDALRDAAVDHVTNGGASEVVPEPTWDASLLAGRLPPFPEVPDALPFALSTEIGGRETESRGRADAPLRGRVRSGPRAAPSGLARATRAGLHRSSSRWHQGGGSPLPRRSAGAPRSALRFGSASQTRTEWRRRSGDRDVDRDAGERLGIDPDRRNPAARALLEFLDHRKPHELAIFVGQPKQPTHGRELAIDRRVRRVFFLAAFDILRDH